MKRGSKLYVAPSKTIMDHCFRIHNQAAFGHLSLFGIFLDFSSWVFPKLTSSEFNKSVSLAKSNAKKMLNRRGNIMRIP